MTDKQVRRSILEVMNKQRRAARHEREIRMQLRQIEDALEDEGYVIEDERVVQAVNYLAEAKMLKQAKETKTIQPVSGLRRSSLRAAPRSTKHTRYYYTLTARAIDELEGETEYSKKPFIPLQSIQINAVNAPVVIGSNNIVENNVTLFSQLDELQQIISEADSLDIDTRRDAAGDIESLKQQLAKPNPIGAIIDTLWKNIGRTADLAGVAGLVSEIGKTIAAIIGNPIG